MRNIIGEKNDVDFACRSLKETGFINYFGLQRFGSAGYQTSHSVGRILIHSGYKEVENKIYKKAVEYLLKPIDGSGTDLLEKAKKVYMETKDPEEALKVKEL